MKFVGKNLSRQATRTQLGTSSLLETWQVQCIMNSLYSQKRKSEILKYVRANENLRRSYNGSGSQLRG